MLTPTHRSLALIAVLGIVTTLGWAAPAQAVRVVATVTVGSSPADLVVTPDDRYAYVTNSGSNTVSVVDTTTLSVTSTIPVGTGPNGIAMTPDGAKVFVANTASSTYSVIRTADNTVIQTIPAPTFCVVSGMAMHPAGQTVYLGCGSNASIYAMDTSNYAMTRITRGTVSMDALAVAPDASQLVGVSFGQWKADYVNVPWSPGIGHSPAAIGSVEDGSTFYTANTDGTLTGLTHLSGEIVTSTIGASLAGIAITADSRTAYVTDSGAGALFSVELATRVVTRVAATGTSPRGVALSPTGTRAYVVNSGSNSLSVISFAPEAVDDPSQVPTAPLQAYAVEGGEECGVNVPESADWPALRSMRRDGWQRSWAQWPHAGRGGIVCERQPYYTSAGNWAVR